VTVVAAATPVIEPTDDPRNPRRRLSALFDEGTLALITPEDDSGMLAGTGLIEEPRASPSARTPRSGRRHDGKPAAKWSWPRTNALADGVCPIGLWHSGGARLREGVVSLHVGLVFAIMTRASGRCRRSPWSSARRPAVRPTAGAHRRGHPRP
jgi:acetyl-CoA/propionyl-CoA carboxylase carboxyl transferase subunit